MNHKDYIIIKGDKEKTRDRIINVVGEISDYKKEELILGKGYICNDCVYVYSEELTGEYPTFKLNNEMEYEFRKSDNADKVYHRSCIRSMDILDTVSKVDPKEVLYDVDAISDMNAAKSICVPEIKDTDDFLKRIIKTAIIDKKVNTNRLRSRMDQTYAFSNLLTALNGNTKMSVPSFLIWCDLLGVSFNISVYDNGTDPIDPLQKSLTYDSFKDSIERG